MLKPFFILGLINHFVNLLEIFEFSELIELSLLPKTISRMTSNRLKKLKKALINHLEAVRDIYLKERLLKDMAFRLVLANIKRGRRLDSGTGPSATFRYRI